jgi:hypothetical protein
LHVIQLTSFMTHISFCIGDNIDGWFSGGLR